MLVSISGGKPENEAKENYQIFCDSMDYNHYYFSSFPIFCDDFNDAQTCK